jgi:glycosyltransferase involved in cell wall biosynthesis
VVVPAYNEEELIGEVLDGIPDYVAKVYAVDDGSADMTGAIIEDYSRPRSTDRRHPPQPEPGGRGGDHLRLSSGRSRTGWTSPR